MALKSGLLGLQSAIQGRPYEHNNAGIVHQKQKRNLMSLQICMTFFLLQNNNEIKFQANARTWKKTHKHHKKGQHDERTRFQQHRFRHEGEFLFSCVLFLLSFYVSETHIICLSASSVSTGLLHFPFLSRCGYECVQNIVHFGAVISCLLPAWFLRSPE